MKKRKFWKRISAIGLTAAMLFSLAGCGKTQIEPSSQASSSAEQAVLWVYGADQSFAKLNAQYNSNALPDKQLQVEYFSEDEMTFSEFQKKLHGRLLSGDGPDLVLSCYIDLFRDIRKVTETGVLADWDGIVADWDSEALYTEAIAGANRDFDKTYVLPLHFDPDIVVTTKSGMEQYDFQESDFSDFTQTTDTMLSLWKKVDPTKQTLYFQIPEFTRAIPEIFDFRTRSSALSTEKVQELLAKWKEFGAYQKNAVYGKTMFGQDGSVLFDGSRVLDFCQYSELKRQIGQGAFSAEQLQDLVFFPQRDVNGRVSGIVCDYALLPASCRNVEAVADYVKNLMNHASSSSPDVVLSQKAEHEQNRMGVSGDVLDRLDALLNQPMQLTYRNDYMVDCEFEISNGLTSYQESDWQSLTDQINVYLSE